MPDIRSNVNHAHKEHGSQIRGSLNIAIQRTGTQKRTTLTTQRTQSPNHHDTRTSTRKHGLETTHSQLTSSRSPTYRQKRPSHQHPHNWPLSAHSHSSRSMRFKTSTTKGHERANLQSKGLHTRRKHEQYGDSSYSAVPIPDYTEKERQVCVTDTDTGILPGITRKCNMRSKFR